MRDNLRNGGLYRHKAHFRVIRVEGFLDPNGWLTCLDADGRKSVVRASELVPLSADEVRRFAPLFERGKVIKGPWRS